MNRTNSEDFLAQNNGSVKTDIFDDPTLQDPDGPDESLKPVFNEEELNQALAGAIACDDEIAKAVVNLVKPANFNTNVQRLIVEVVFDHLRSYNQRPHKHVLLNEVRSRYGSSPALDFYIAEVGVCLEAFQPGMYPREFFVRKCRDAGIKSAVKKMCHDAIDGLNKQKFELGSWLEKGRQLQGDMCITPVARGFRFCDAKSQARAEYLIKEHLDKGVVGFVGGEWGAGKTFYVIDMIGAVATGSLFLGKYKVKKGNVLYICGEGGGRIAERFMAWQQYHKTRVENAVCLNRRYNLMDPAAVAQIKQDAMSIFVEPPVLVVADTLSKMNQGDENSPKDMEAIATNVASLAAEWGCTFLFVHHPGKDRSKGLRGTSKFLGDSDCVFMLDKTAEPNITIVTNEKQKDRAGLGEYAIKLETVLLLDPETGLPWLDEDGEHVSSLVCLPHKEKPGALRAAAVEHKEKMALVKWLRLIPEDEVEALTVKEVHFQARMKGLTRAESDKNTYPKVNQMVCFGWLDKVGDRYKRTEQGSLEIVTQDAITSVF